MKTEQPIIVETTEEGFERDVVERSKELPVVVDFWAQWCGPCRVLAPVLEKLAREYAGQFALVKANTDRVPGVAAGFGIRSIPAVFGIKDGKIVDSFAGALPEPALRQWLEAILPTPAEELARDARRLEPLDPEGAEHKYRQSIELAPHEPAAQIGLARVLAAQGKSQEAQAIIDELEKRGFLEPEAEKLKAELMLHLGNQQTGGVAAARAEAAANPSDLGLQLALAEALAAAKQFEEALDTSLKLVEKDRKGVGEAARQTMLAIFQLLPPDSPLADEYRRRLSLALY